MDVAARAGMKTMREHALEKVLAGETTLEEVRRRVLMSDLTS